MKTENERAYAYEGRGNFFILIHVYTLPDIIFRLETQYGVRMMWIYTPSPVVSFIEDGIITRRSSHS